MQRYLIIFLLLFSITLSDTSFSLGHTFSRYLQTVSLDHNGTRYSRSGILSGRPAFFIEFDSRNHPLFLANDYVAYGLGIISEAHYRDYYTLDDYLSLFPLYATYYVNVLPELALGFGGNITIQQTRYKNEPSMNGQQFGKHFFIRYRWDPYSFLETGIMQTCAQSGFGEQEDTVSFYDTTNFIFRYGFYLENNTL
jgi:hypothetical protein